MTGLGGRRSRHFLEDRNGGKAVKTTQGCLGCIGPTRRGPPARYKVGKQPQVQPYEKPWL